MGVSLSSRVGIYAQLGRLLDAGLPATEALRLVGAHSRGDAREALEGMRRSIEGGAAFANAAEREPVLFGTSSHALLVAGEKVGTLSSVLQALSASMELRLDVRRQLLRACIYPVVLLTLVFFVPKVHLLVSEGVGAYLAASLFPFAATIAVLAVLAIGVPRALGAILGAARTTSLLHRLPFVGRLAALAAQIRFCRHFGGTLSAGLDTFASLGLSAHASGDPRWIETADVIERRLRAGASLEQALGELGWLDGSMLLAVAAGERSGKLPEALEQQARVDQATFTHRLNVVVQLASVMILLTSYGYAALAVLGEYQAVQAAAAEQMQDLLGNQLLLP